MFQEDRHQPIHLDLCFGAMMDEYALQYRMRGGSRHAQQRISELRFHAYQFLQFCKVHVLEVADFHGSDPFVSVSQGVRMEPEQRGAAAFPFLLASLNEFRERSVPVNFDRASFACGHGARLARN
jgi:hypothetical protein